MMRLSSASNWGHIGRLESVVDIDCLEDVRIVVVSLFVRIALVTLSDSPLTPSSSVSASDCADDRSTCDAMSLLALICL